MRGQQIIVSAQPKGTFLGGNLGDTSLPGTLMQVQASVSSAPSNFVGGEPNWVALVVTSSGNPGPIFVLLQDDLQGALPDIINNNVIAGVIGTRRQLYSPVQGEDMNILADAASGTGNACHIGQQFEISSTPGIVIPATGSPVRVPFTCMENITDFTGPSLVWMKYNGS